MPTIEIDRPKRGRPKLSTAMEHALFAAFCRRARAEDLATQFGVCRATVYNVVNRLKKESRLVLDHESGLGSPESIGDPTGTSRAEDTRQPEAGGIGTSEEGER